MKTFPADFIADLSAFLSEGELVATDIGPDGLLYMAIALNELEYRTDNGPDQPTFAVVKPRQPQSYRIVALLDGEPTLDFQASNEEFNIHHVQPLTKDRIILACSRSRYRGPSDFDKNGRIYYTDGRPAGEVLLGDGINSMQTTSDGTIWTSFFDEGIFGNYGWNDPVGAPGLIAWTASGKAVYKFRPENGLDDCICDCYALNVASERDTWLYYYTEFPLVHLRDCQVVNHWDIPLEGSHAFAVSQGFAVFSGGYDDRHTYHLFDLRKPGSVREVATFGLTDGKGKLLKGCLIDGRGSKLHVVRKEEVWSIDANKVIDTLG